MKSKQTECRRCGTCCHKGGPALHNADLSLVTSGRLPIDKLLTIRRGELVDHPLTGGLQTLSQELIKITGCGRQWRCIFFSDGEGCTIYSIRPLACRVLKCWDLEEITELIGKDTLTRFDILAAGDPLRKLAEEHERCCPCPDMEQIRRSVRENLPVDLSGLQELVDRDLDFRSLAVKDHGLSLGEELFVFGRPIFRLLQAVGFSISERAGRIHLVIGDR